MEIKINPLAVRAAPTLDLPPAVLVGALEAIRATGSGQLPGAGLPRNRYLVAEHLEALGYRIARAEDRAGSIFEVVTECGLFVVANGRAGVARGGARLARLMDQAGAAAA